MEVLKNNGKKFDICLSNPPYSNTLHLQFLEKYCEIAKNIISIQPCEFITRTHLKPTYKKQKEKYKNSIGKHLYDLEVLKKNPFDAGIDTNIGIYVLNETGGFDYDNFYKEYDKHYLNIESKFNTGITFNEKLEKYDNQKYFVPIRTDGIYERWWTLQLINYLDIIVDGKVYSGDYKGLTISEARKKNPHENPRNADRTTMGVSFNSLEEAINCRDSLKTEAYMFIIALFKTTRKNPLNKIPFLNYKNHLSNNDIFDLFDINNDLRKDIIKEMQPFMSKSSMNGSEIGKTLINIQKKYLEELFEMIGMKYNKEEILKMNNGKKFDICLSNPPYDRDLHLKFIDKCINICEKLINISPGGFINNIGMYNTKTKLTQNIIKHLKDVEFIDVEKSNKYFGLGKNGIKSELHIGLYEHDYTDGKPILDEDVLNVYKKIRYTCKTNLRNHFINKEKFGKYGVRIFRMHYDRNTPYYDNIICTQGKAVEGIDFKTENEKNNFIKSIHTWVYEFMFKLEDTNPAHLPYLDDYTKEWTNERLYKLFDITEDDKKLLA